MTCSSKIAYAVLFMLKAVSKLWTTQTRGIKSTFVIDEFDGLLE